MVTVLGLDIGGANTKTAFVVVKDGRVTDFNSELEYFPFWKRNSDQFTSLLLGLNRKLIGSGNLEGVGVTLTAELSDAFRTKREGVSQILDCVAKVFGEKRVMVLDVDAELRSMVAAKAEPLKVASANWVATGWMVAQHVRDCVVVDVGSTSTSIIPVVNGEVEAFGMTDMEKLSNGELVYTGGLRTNVAATVQVVPLRGRNVRVASELFAQSADVHLILGNITEEDYTSETADGKGKSRPASLARLARIVCADVEMLTEQEIIQIAKYVCDRQIVQIAYGLNQVYSRLEQNAKRDVPAIVTGLGKDFLARKAAEKAGITKILSLASLFPNDAALLSPAVGVALMMVSKMEGKRPVWKP
ncbi:MAG TPA: hydantoinase/oxoprolinase family protein [Candidatus Nanoarchaeia archaeon]|nr:hydantoinase/oxoprolinase family protein [Candidatus Nanoarchaeia archaeon]